MATQLKWKPLDDGDSNDHEEVSATRRSVDYLVETDTNFFKLTVPAGYKVTYGPIFARANDKGTGTTTHGVPMALRLYEGSRLAAVLHNVIQFRQLDLVIEQGEYNSSTGEVSWRQVPIVQMDTTSPGKGVQLNRR